MTTAMSLILVAHLIGESWHMADALLYGGASLGLVFGIGLFVWGRVERGRDPNSVHADERHRHEPLLRDPSGR